MSAFLVSHDHIDALLTYAVDRRASYFSPEANTRVDITRDNAEEIGRILLHENERSVRTRYQHFTREEELPGSYTKEDELQAADNYSFRRFPGILRPLDILCGIKCLDYQSCEHDGWEGSLARRILLEIQDDAIRALPGYDGAIYEFSRARPRAHSKEKSS